MFILMTEHWKATCLTPSVSHTKRSTPDQFRTQSEVLYIMYLARLVGYGMRST